MRTFPPRKFRSAQADRMGFAWETHELPDMTLEDAQLILAENDAALADGTIGNEDTATMDYARALIARHEQDRLH